MGDLLCHFKLIKWKRGLNHNNNSLKNIKKKITDFIWVYYKQQFVKSYILN